MKLREFFEKNGVRVADQVIFIINSCFAVGIIPILLCKWRLIPVSEIILNAYWIVAITSPFVVAITLLRWIKKYPTPMTWLQSAFGVTSVCTWIYASLTLLRFYNNEGLTTNIIAAILVAPTVPLSLFAIYLTRKAIKSGFKH